MKDDKALSKLENAVSETIRKETFQEKRKKVIFRDRSRNNKRVICSWPRVQVKVRNRLTR